MDIDCSVAKRRSSHDRVSSFVAAGFTIEGCGFETGVEERMETDRVNLSLIKREWSKANKLTQDRVNESEDRKYRVIQREVETRIPDNGFAASTIVIRGKLDDLVAVRAPPRYLTARDTLKTLLMHPAKKTRRSLPGVSRSSPGRGGRATRVSSFRWRKFGDARNRSWPNWEYR